MAADDDLRWFDEVYRRRFPNDTAMIADLDQQLARFKEEPPADDPDTLCPMCGPPPCRHTKQDL